ncbi:hypothetical protein BT69DRAFT_249001 [Atractiella rhizophila]|nr:hypothetical protein BT69DRAFT_249001 [Atractiella rhizophila]
MSSRSNSNPSNPTTPTRPLSPPSKKRRVHFQQSPSKPRSHSPGRALSPKGVNQSPEKRRAPAAFRVYEDRNWKRDSFASDETFVDEREEARDEVTELKAVTIGQGKGVKRKTPPVASNGAEELRKFVTRAKAADKNNEVAALQSEVGRLKERNAILEAALPAAKGSGADNLKLQQGVKELEGRLRKAWKENEELIEKVARESLRSEVVEEQKFKETVVLLRKTEKEKSDLLSQVEHLSQAAKTSKSALSLDGIPEEQDIDELNAERDHFKALAQSAKRQLDETTGEIESLKARIGELETELERGTTRRGDLSTDTITLDTAMAQLNAAHEQLSQAMSELEGVDILRADLSASIAREEQLKVQLEHGLRYQGRMEEELKGLRWTLDSNFAEGRKEDGRASERVKRLNQRLTELTELTARQCRIEMQSQMHLARLKAELLGYKKGAADSHSEALLAKDKVIRELGETKRQLLAQLENETRKKAHLQERLARFEMSQAELEKEHFKCPQRVEKERRRILELEKQLREAMKTNGKDKGKAVERDPAPSRRKVTFRMPEEIDDMLRNDKEQAGDWSLLGEASGKEDWSFEMVTRSALGDKGRVRKK